jgi:hypothetical protein
MDKTIHCVILCCPGKDFCVGYPRYELNCDPVDTVDKMKTDYWRLWEEYDLDTNPKMRREVMRGSSFDDDVHGMFMQQQDRMVLFDIHKPVIAQPRTGMVSQQRMAAEIDARGHIPGRLGFARLAEGWKGGSITAAFKERNERFLDGPAKGFATKSSLDGRLGGKFGVPGAKL